MDPWSAVLKFQISELRETRWMLPEEGQPRLAPGLHRSLNYPEDGEKQAQQEVVRGHGWGKSHPKSRLETADSENSGDGGENSRISGHRVVHVSHQDMLIIRWQTCFKALGNFLISRAPVFLPFPSVYSEACVCSQMSESPSRS